jgi:hypothetical protein
MDLIRVFPRRTNWTPTDDLSFVGEPPLFRPEEMPVKISITFSWDIKEGERLKRSWSRFYRDVQLGGPALDDRAYDFTPGLFVKAGITFTSRGCPRNCPWCVVPKLEGKIRELPIQPGNIVADNNLLACSRGHIEAVFEMLGNQKGIDLQAIDSRLLQQWHVDQIKKLKIKALWVACDTNGAYKNLERTQEGIRMSTDEMIQAMEIIGALLRSKPEIIEAIIARLKEADKMEAEKNDISKSYCEARKKIIKGRKNEQA